MLCVQVEHRLQVTKPPAWPSLATIKNYNWFDAPVMAHGVEDNSVVPAEYTKGDGRRVSKHLDQPETASRCANNYMFYQNLIHDILI